jgi:hypothetical protein
MFVFIGEEREIAAENRQLQCSVRRNWSTPIVGLAGLRLSYNRRADIIPTKNCLFLPK